jgi:hypothetical protein
LNQLYGSFKFFRRNIGKLVGHFLGRQVIDPVPGHMAPSGDPVEAKIAIAVIYENGPVLRCHLNFRWLNSNILPPIAWGVLVDFDWA